jgi:folate-binding protein YgfZ
MSTLPVEYGFLHESAAVIDLSSRSRLCVAGTDRVRFLNGQVTNNVKDLKAGEGCYAALVNAKGKMQSDLNIYCLPDELLLDFEPGLTQTVAQRLEKYVIADDVQILDVSGNYGMLTVQGPKSSEILQAAGLTLPGNSLHWTKTPGSSGEIYCINNARGTLRGFDIFVPTSRFSVLYQTALQAAQDGGGGAGTLEALEAVRIEAGIPRFGIDMDETNLAPETGIESRAISYSKGCYIGQEVISRIRAYGQVAKSLRGLRLPTELSSLPGRHEKLFHSGKEAGYVTSAIQSPGFKANIALGYVRREHSTPGTTLQVGSADGQVSAVVSDLPFTGAGTN